MRLCQRHTQVAKAFLTLFAYCNMAVLGLILSKMWCANHNPDCKTTSNHSRTSKKNQSQQELVFWTVWIGSHWEFWLDHKPSLTRFEVSSHGATSNLARSRWTLPLLVRCSDCVNDCVNDCIYIPWILPWKTLNFQTADALCSGQNPLEQFIFWTHVVLIKSLMVHDRIACSVVLFVAAHLT